MITFVAENIPYKVFELFPFLTSIFLILIIIGMALEYAKKKVNIRWVLFSFGLSTFITIGHFAFCKFNWNYSLIMDETAASFIINLLWIVGGAILYFIIIILFSGLCIFASIEKFRRK